MPLDADDIARLYADHARPLVAFFARRTFDPQAASELMAETFAAAVADRRSFRGDAPEAWLYGIARHQLSGWYRKAAVERKALKRLGLEPPHLTDVEYERVEELAGLQELRARVADAARRAPAESRDALRLRIVEERPYPEVAAELDIAEPAARARVSRALRGLAAELEQETAVADWIDSFGEDLVGAARRDELPVARRVRRAPRRPRAPAPPPPAHRRARARAWRCRRGHQRRRHRRRAPADRGPAARPDLGAGRADAAGRDRGGQRAARAGPRRAACRGRSGSPSRRPGSPARPSARSRTARSG